MKELSLHILDIAENSFGAGAENLEIEISQDTAKGLLRITLADDGAGMDREFLKTVLDPFTTTRTTRKVGLGLPLFRMAARQAGGELEIESEKNRGTRVSAVFALRHIDRAPIGDIAGTAVTLIQGHPKADIRLCLVTDGKTFKLETAEIKKELGEVSIDTPEVLAWIKEYIEEGSKAISFVD